MKITEETANLMMDSIAFALTQSYTALYELYGIERFTEWLNERTRELFVAFCEDEGITEIECNVKA